MHLVITDSGLGGLAICAALERVLTGAPSHGVSQITYVNAWPEEGRGYNDLPDVATRAGVLDRVMQRLESLRPGLVLVACNTLSILYEHTQHRARGATPVQGIVDAGVALFMDSLTRDEASTILLLGTRTTIESGVHRARLLDRGIAPGRVHAVACHGLATAIETDPQSEATSSLIARCAEQAPIAATGRSGHALYLGLCCTHYGFVRERLRDALALHAHRPVEVLDPNDRLVHDMTPRLLAPSQPGPRRGPVPVRMISKVRLDASKRENVAALIEPTSPATANALRAYEHVPDLF